MPTNLKKTSSVLLVTSKDYAKILQFFAGLTPLVE